MREGYSVQAKKQGYAKRRPQATCPTASIVGPTSRVRFRNAAVVRNVSETSRSGSELAFCMMSDKVVVQYHTEVYNGLLTFSRMVCVHSIPVALPVVKVRGHSGSSATVSVTVAPPQCFVLVIISKKALKSLVLIRLFATLTISAQVLEATGARFLAMMMLNASSVLWLRVANPLNRVLVRLASILGTRKPKTMG